jgi:hypothetical protein
MSITRTLWVALVMLVALPAAAQTSSTLETVKKRGINDLWTKGGLMYPLPLR